MDNSTVSLALCLPLLLVRVYLCCCCCCCSGCMYASAAAFLSLSLCLCCCVLCVAVCASAAAVAVPAALSSRAQQRADQASSACATWRLDLALFSPTRQPARAEWCLLLLRYLIQCAYSTAVTQLSTGAQIRNTRRSGPLALIPTLWCHCRCPTGK